MDLNMKTIGMIGGMSWESTVEYYRVINQEVGRLRGGFHSAKIVMVSVDFAEIEQMQDQDDWDAAAKAIGEAANQCQAGGAQFIVLCTNTMHKVVDRAARVVDIPFLHIADATARRIRASGFTTVALLGTRYTMEDTFYRDRLEQEHGLHVLVPDDQDRSLVHQVIYDELVHGIIRDESRRELTRIIAGLAREGAQGAVAGCTEIGLLVKPNDSPVPLFDTARIHAEEAVALSLSGS